MNSGGLLERRTSSGCNMFECVAAVGDVRCVRALFALIRSEPAQLLPTSARRKTSLPSHTASEHARRSQPSEAPQSESIVDWLGLEPIRWPATTANETSKPAFEAMSQIPSSEISKSSRVVDFSHMFPLQQQHLGCALHICCMLGHFDAFDTLLHELAAYPALLNPLADRTRLVLVAAAGSLRGVLWNMSADDTPRRPLTTPFSTTALNSCSNCWRM